ncbi:hypothetical protein DSO57_1020471 [Entomophthora muscae]|uniref:Uncharacterized protein n=1 Tax=Entomophthora muscae TaxID=34485 RepID=A0ACC2TEP7_9FUNG|nr:hypothetical protein DSO57_1020471 [Entomophthora muscae]
MPANFVAPLPILETENCVPSQCPEFYAEDALMLSQVIYLAALVVNNQFYVDLGVISVTPAPMKMDTNSSPSEDAIHNAICAIDSCTAGNDACSEHLAIQKPSAKTVRIHYLFAAILVPFLLVHLLQLSAIAIFYLGFFPTNFLQLFPLVTCFNNHLLAAN